MKMTRAWSALTAALVVATGVPAAADDDGAALSAKVDQAIAAATSYHVAVSGPNGLAVDILEAGHDRVRVQSGAPAPAYESVVIGTAMYFRSAGTAWAAVVVPPVKRSRRNLLYMAAPDSKLEPLADRSERGVAYGAFGSLALGNGGVPGTMECTYDRTTYLPHACTVVLQTLPVPVRVTYDRWNDPANAVEAPPGVPPPTPA
ncbi:MAG: hypothetical protein M3N49_06170, partial [Candidatus Eremiobacteraeota bacterium]|nr:hypothetical protein [Candidatus Eremiobacteraeota bacterium]